MTGAIRSRGTLAETEAGEAATAAQLLGLDATAPTLNGVLVSVSLPWARRAARCLLSSPPLLSFLRPSEASFATLAVTLDDESLATLPTVGARAARADAPLLSFLWPSEASFATLAMTLAVTLSDESLATLPTVGARAARADAFFGPPEGTNLGILEDGRFIT